MQRIGTLKHCWWENQMVQLLRKIVCQFFCKLNAELLYYPEILLRGVYQKKWKHVQTKTYTQTYTDSSTIHDNQSVETANFTEFSCLFAIELHKLLLIMITAITFINNLIWGWPCGWVVKFACSTAGGPVFHWFESWARTWHCSSDHAEAASHMPQLEGPTMKNLQLCTRGL